MDINMTVRCVRFFNQFINKKSKERSNLCSKIYQNDTDLKQMAHPSEQWTWKSLLFMFIDQAYLVQSSSLSN